MGDPAPGVEPFEVELAGDPGLLVLVAEVEPEPLVHIVRLQVLARARVSTGDAGRSRGAHPLLRLAHSPLLPSVIASVLGNGRASLPTRSHPLLKLRSIVSACVRLTPGPRPHPNRPRPRRRVAGRRRPAGDRGHAPSLLGTLEYIARLPPMCCNILRT